jgi:hypothetical protein
MATTFYWLLDLKRNDNVNFCNLHQFSFKIYQMYESSIQASNLWIFGNMILIKFDLELFFFFVLVAWPFVTIDKNEILFWTHP